MHFILTRKLKFLLQRVTRSPASPFISSLSLSLSRLQALSYQFTLANQPQPQGRGGPLYPGGEGGPEVEQVEPTCIFVVKNLRKDFGNSVALATTDNYRS